MTLDSVKKQLDKRQPAQARPPFVVVDDTGAIIWPEGDIPPGNYKTYRINVSRDLWEAL